MWIEQGNDGGNLDSVQMHPMLIGAAPRNLAQPGATFCATLDSPEQSHLFTQSPELSTRSGVTMNSPCPR
jgi:hypothetical protein